MSPAALSAGASRRTVPPRWSGAFNQRASARKVGGTMSRARRLSALPGRPPAGQGLRAHPRRGSAFSMLHARTGGAFNREARDLRVAAGNQGFTVLARIRRDLLRHGCLSSAPDRRARTGRRLASGKVPQAMEPAAAPVRQRLKVSARTGRWPDEDPDCVHGGFCACAGHGRVLRRGIWRRDSRRSGRCGLAITPPWRCQSRLRDHAGQFRRTVLERAAPWAPSCETGSYRAA
jgi:hypothetical protein